jgi:hypothetical protein
MLLPATPLIYRKRKIPPRRMRRVAPPTPPAQELILEAAAFLPGGPPLLVLTFDRAIDLNALVGSAITVRDGVGSGWLWQATLGWEMLDATSAQFVLDFVEEASGPGVILNATGASGIVAVDNAGTWAGATDLELPFP